MKIMHSRRIFVGALVASMAWMAAANADLIGDVLYTDSAVELTAAASGLDAQGPYGNGVPTSSTIDSTGYDRSNGSNWSYNALADGSARANASYAFVHAWATGFLEVTESPTSGPPSNPPAVGVPMDDLSVAIARFEDTMEIPGSYTGRTVSVRFGYGLYGSLTTTGPNPYQAYLGLSVYIDGLSYNLVAPLNNHPLHPQYVTLDVPIGEPFPFSEQLTASTSLGLGDMITLSDVSQALADANGGNTGAFSIDLLTTGYSYITASGTVYPTTAADPAGVPEPGSAVILGTSLVALGLCFARLKASRRPQ